MRSAVRKGQWQEAWKYADAVLEEHGDDVSVLVMVAKAAHANDQPSRAADVLADACRAEAFSHEQRVRQTMIAMISAGRLHDGIQLLEEAIEQQPLQDETRRWLYDFYMGTENRKSGLVHGRFLVRHRKFDLELLKSLSNTQRRSMDAKPLEEMAKRNPEDKRPLVGSAKIKFDAGDYGEAIKQLREIVQAHPDYLPAQSLLARALAAAGKLDELEKWAATPLRDIESLPDYWIAVGDWARAKQFHAQAARAYWEAARRDVDLAESWFKLNSAIGQLDQAEADIPAGTIEAIDHRATLLSKFDQLKNRFERSGGISRAVAIQIVDTLRDLGRLWEAEAWAAVATTLPEDDSVSVEQTRNQIVSLLRKDTPWQLTEGQPALAVELSYLMAPAISNIASQDPTKSDSPATGPANDTKLRLVNEAGQRGLTYFGRTGDDLHKPGIMLHETLGCGGGTIDFDLDGWSDLYLVGAGGKPPKRDSQANVLMRNVGGVFVPASKPSGTGDTGFAQGVAVGDVNEDGFPDLLVLNYGPNTLLINNGDGTFTDSSGALPNNANSISWSASAAIADLDGDGISDLSIVNYCAGLEPSTQECPLKDSDSIPSCTPMMFPAELDSFFQGSGDGTFVDRTDAWGAKPTVVGRGLGVVAGCFDEQAGVDLFIANDMTNNHFWSRSAKKSSFALSESAMLRGLAADDRSNAQGSMGIATADFDNDGDIDFYVTNFYKEYNTYHQQQSAGLWQDRTSAQGLIVPTLPLVGFGTEAIDIDNDGQQELVVSNGHVDMFSRGNERSVYAHPMQVFHHNDQGQFESIERSMGGKYLSRPHVGRALWTIDVNRDHQTDLVVTHQTEPVALLVNRTTDPGSWLELELHGRNCSRDAIGALIQVRCDGRRWLAAVTAGDGYLCSNERVVRIGVGDATEDCQLTVTWPDGSEQEYRDLAVSHRWMIIQGEDNPF